MCGAPCPGRWTALVKLFMIDSEEGAKTTLYCATSDAVAQQTGLYYDQCAVATPTPVARDAALAQALWTASEGWTQD
jgi:retinol dehydrogenase-12